MEPELNDEFFQYIYSLPKESESIISDNEVFNDLGLHQYMHTFSQENLYIDIEYDKIDSLIQVYFKKIFDPDENVMLYNHDIVYSYFDCNDFIKLYENYIYTYQYNLSLFINDNHYKDIYLNCKRISHQHLLIRPKNFELFKIFINKYYEYFIDKLQITIKYLKYNLTIYNQSLPNVYFSNVELLELLTDINEIISTKTTFQLFKEYGIPIKMKNKNTLIKNKLMYKYIHKYEKKFTLDIKVLLIEYYNYEYLYATSNGFISTNDILSNSLYNFNIIS